MRGLTAFLVVHLTAQQITQIFNDMLH